MNKPQGWIWESELKKYAEYRGVTLECYLNRPSSIIYEKAESPELHKKDDILYYWKIIYEDE